MKVPSLSMVPGYQSPKEGERGRGRGREREREKEGERGRGREGGKGIPGSLNIWCTKNQKQKTP